MLSSSVLDVIGNLSDEWVGHAEMQFLRSCQCQILLTHGRELRFGSLKRWSFGHSKRAMDVEGFLVRLVAYRMSLKVAN